MNTDPQYLLLISDQHLRRLRDEAAEARLCGRSKPRRALAASLRRAADRLDPAPLGLRSALR